MTHSSKSSTAYARFIPREEIEVVSTWRFDNVDGTPHPEDVEVPPPEPPGPTPEAIAADMEALRRQAHEEGYAEGHAVGCAETRLALEEPMRQAAESATRRFDEVLGHMREELAKTQVLMAQAVLDMACELARQVVRRELALDPKSIEPVVKDAVNALVTDSLPVTVRLHPDDLAALEAGWTEPPAPNAHRFVADASITPGGCVVEAPGTGVNATLEQRWQRVIANLGLDSAWESTGHSAGKGGHDNLA